MIAPLMSGCNGPRRLVVCIALAGCTPSVMPPTSGATGKGVSAVDRAACAPEAVLLGEDARVLAAPSAGAETVRSLSRNAPIYLCDASGGYRGVMFPAPGRPADCDRRDGDAACPTGWIAEPVAIEVAG